MDVKEFLLTNKAINQSEIARLMWPNNVGAKNYLNAKLNNLNNRTFTRNDAIRAKQVLETLGIEFSTLTVADKY